MAQGLLDRIAMHKPNTNDTPPAGSPWLLRGLILLVVNASYLAAYAEPSLFYVSNVLLHVGLGLVLLVAALPFAVRALRAARKQPDGGSRSVVVAILAACALTGVYLVVAGNPSPMRPVLVAHIIAGVVGVAFLAVILPRRTLGYLTVGALAFPFAVTLLGRAGERAVNRELPPFTMEGEAAGGAEGPFFPSSARTTDGKVVPASKFFMESETCGKSGCHVDVYEEWDASAHHFASFNNQWYRKSIEYMQSVTGVTASKWCGGCHDHALLFTGLMDRPIEEVIDTPEAQVGLGCVSCHAIVDVDDTMGNGGFVIEYPPLHDLATSDNFIVEAVHDFVVKVDPEPHRRTFLKPLHQGDSSTFCSACHKVHLDAPVNDYRWIRGFNEYDNWQASGVSGQGARSFYYPAAPMTCKECHMPAVASNDPGNDGGTVRSHRFAAANTALPTANANEKQLEAVVDFLKAAQVTVDLFALVRGGDLPEGVEGTPSGGRQLATTFAVGEEAEMTAPARTAAPAVAEEVQAPLDRAGITLVPGESVRIDAVVRTRNVGHFFPGGTVDAFEVWLELEAVDDDGRVIFWNGFVEDDGKGPVEPSAHFYRSFMLDGKGNPINKRNAWAARSVLYVSLIPPGAANTVRFRLDVPEDMKVGSNVTLKARLNYRKFAWWNTQWAYAGVRDPSQGTFDLSKAHDDGRWVFTGDTSGVSGELKEIPDLPIVTMAESEVTLPVGASATEPTAEPERASDGDTRVAALRWNDYGIGLFLQGDLRGAERAFLNVTEIDPSYADGFVNVARVRVQEGDPAGAREMLDQAFALAPDLAKAHYFYGLTLKTDGRYDEALEHFRAAAKIYPRDRVVRNQIGRIHFLKREFGEAVAELEKTLTIDPEDLEAHYNLMLAYQGLGEAEKAEQHRELYLRFKADEASQFITGDYRRLHPADNNERLTIHEHHSSYDGSTTSSTSGGDM